MIYNLYYLSKLQSLLRVKKWIIIKETLSPSLFRMISNNFSISDIRRM